MYYTAGWWSSKHLIKSGGHEFPPKLYSLQIMIAQKIFYNLVPINIQLYIIEIEEPNYRCLITKFSNQQT